MEFWTSIRRRHVGALLLGVVTVLLGAVISGGDTTATENEVSITTNAGIYLATTTLPVLVSGVVEAADSVTIYAQTAGVVSSLAAREGAVVGCGAVLAIQSAPVASAQVELATAERDLSLIEQGLAVSTATSEVQKATVAAYSAEEIAQLRSTANGHRTSEAGDALTTALSSGALSAVAAISYVDAHRPLFTAAGLREYESVVRSLYGQVPDYFSNGIRSGNETVDFTAIYTQLASGSELSEADLVTLSTLVGTELQALSQVLQTAEADAFDTLSESAVAEYFSVRTEVISALQTVLTVEGAFNQVVDGTLQDVVNQNQGVAISAVDESIARLRSEYAARIQAQATVVGTAALKVATAAESLKVATAPFSGRVGFVFAKEGEYVTPGAPLLTLVGDGAREVVVTVPTALLSAVSVGTAFEQAGIVRGVVNRVGATTVGGSGVVVISLTGDVVVGESITGTLMTTVQSVYAVPRRFVFFDAEGPFITYEDNTRSRVQVAYDAGATLYLTVTDVRHAALLPAVSITF